MLVDMSLVTMLCSSTAAAVEAMKSFTLPIAVLMAPSDVARSDFSAIQTSPLRVARWNHGHARL